MYIYIYKYIVYIYAIYVNSFTYLIIYFELNTIV